MWIRKYNRPIAISFLALFAFQLGLGFPLMAHGPTNPEMGGFSPVEDSEWVNPFSGDFSYNIPLFEVGGYPVNIAYSSNAVSPEAPAGWVGLGWSLNPGAVNRNMRALPDDFQPEKDEVEQVDRMRENKRIALGVSAQFAEIVGFQVPFELKMSPSARLDVFSSTYGGMGFNFGVGLGFGADDLSGLAAKLSPTGRLSMQFGTESGISVTPSLTLSPFQHKSSKAYSVSVGASTSVSATYNSRSGQTEVNLNYIQLNTTLNAVSGKTFLKAPFESSVGARFTTANRSYIPALQPPVNNQSWAISVAAGGELQWISGALSLFGTYSKQTLADAHNDLLVRNLKPHGYMYYNARNDYNKKLSVYDYNRENDFELDDKTPAVNLAFATYDQFQVTAQGISGAYRLKNNGVNIVSQGHYALHGESNSSIEAKNFGLEAEFGAYGKGALNLGTTISSGHNSGWNKDDLPFFNQLTASAETNNNPYQARFMQQLGVGSNPSEGIYNALHREKAFRFPLSSTGKTPLSYNNIRDEYKVKNALMNSGRESLSLQPTYSHHERAQQVQPMQVLTVDEAEKLSFRKTLAYEQWNPTTQTTSPVTISRETHANDQRHHISELRVSKNDGRQYIFSLPAYNRVHKETSFNVSQDGNGHLVSNAPLCQYGTTTTNGRVLPAGRGITHYLNQRSYSPYAYTYHLTEVLSPDYFDVDHNGPSENDLGNYVTFDYVLWQSNFGWKSPSAINEIGETGSINHVFANLNEGNASNPVDDIGSYTYGEKEVFYVRKMASKDKVALFHIHDNHEPGSTSGIYYSQSLNGEHGSYNGGNYLGRLDSIQVFTVAEYAELEAGNTAIPEQTVHFRYTYELCPNATGRGKLTLKRLFSTYRYNPKSAVNDYHFNYDHNPDYQTYHRDRWGTYQPGVAPQTAAPLNNRSLSNIEYPFTNQQDRANNADLNASAWLLTNIDLPSGGAMRIDYESDDYAYVQDKKAGIACPIAGFGSSPDQPNDPGLTNSMYGNHFVFVDITEKFQAAAESFETASAYWDEAVKHLKQIPIRCVVDVTGMGHHEFIVVYADHLDHGITQTAQGTVYGYIELKPEPIKNKKSPSKLNPIVKLGMQTAYNQFHTRIYNGSLDPGSNPKLHQLLYGLKTFLTDVDAMIRGKVGLAIDREFSKYATLDNRSLLVVADPTGAKLGGGSRVKSITLNDQWDQLSETPQQKQGAMRWTYDYTMEQPIGSNTIRISSGVAEWEPQLGSLENTVLQSVNIRTNDFLEPTGTFYQMKPYGASVFPNANVGYRQVRVTQTGFDPDDPLPGEEPPLNITLHTFYTAKEFPVKTDVTDLEFRKAPARFKSKFSFNGNRYAAAGIASQGFSVVLNDMHGKPRQQLVYRGSEDFPYKQTTYTYQTDGNPLRPELDLQQTFLDPLGKKVTRLASMDYDVTVDTKEFYRLRRIYRKNSNLDVSPLPFFPPFPIPVATYFEFLDEEAVFARSITCTKVISEYGILQEVETIEDGGRYLQKTLAYDLHSRTPVVSETNNEFGNPVYQVNLPAYWMYPTLGPRFERNGIILNNSTSVNGKDILQNGDILLPLDANNEVNGNALQVYHDGTDWVLVDLTTGANSGLSASTGKYRLLAEGSKNMLAASAGQLTLTDNPLTTDRLSLNTSLSYLDAQYQTFTRFQLPVNCNACDNGPFADEDGPMATLALHYRWFPHQTYRPLMDRDYPVNGTGLHDFDMRTAGALSAYPRFWYVSGKQWKKVGINQDKWVKEHVAMYNLFGQPMEVVNEQGVRSTLSWGHNQTLSRFQVFNGAKREVYIEDFEMNDSPNCEDRRRIAYPAGSVSAESRHTGRKALKVDPFVPGQEVKLKIEVLR